MLRRFSSLSQQIGSPLSPKCRFSSFASLPHSLSGIAQSVISRCSDNPRNFDRATLTRKDFLLEISDLVPELARRFRRASQLKPSHVLELLSGFESECGRDGFEPKKVESLLGLFNWSNEQCEGFEHLKESWEIMARVLVRFGLFGEAESLLFEMDRRGIWLNCHETLGSLIRGYVSCGDLNRAVSMYDRMKRRGFLPSISCYNAFLGHLVGARKTQLAVRVCMDMVESLGTGISSNESRKKIVDGVVGLLCADGEIQEARNLVRKLMALGFDVGDLDLNGIVFGYCEKKDFDDAINFFDEIKCAPDILAGNRIIHSVCDYLSTESAHLFMEDLESQGFIPDEITFGILIGWCCREGKLRSSFLYLAEIESRGLKPNMRSYNAIISRLFLKDMWKHARNVFVEMIEKGLDPDLSSYQILLAGYCKERRFNEVTKTVSEMENRGIMSSDSPLGPLLRAFLVLGFGPLAVRIKRENHAEYLRSEFVDEIGNGLYIDTDHIEYDRKVSRILEDSFVADYNRLLMEECNGGDMKVSLSLANEMLHWGQELSFPGFSSLLRGLCSSLCNNPLRVYEKALEHNPRMFNLLDEETSNILAQVYFKRGRTKKGKLVLEGMLRKGLKIDDETFTAIITALCDVGNSRELCFWWNIARKGRWVPRLESCDALLQCLCYKQMMSEALELLENFLVCNPPRLLLETCHMFLEKLSSANLSRVASVLVDELNRRGCVLDNLAYGHVMRGMCKEREYSAALNILDALLAKNLAPEPDISISLIPQLCRANRLKEATFLKEISIRDHPFSSLLINNALMKGLCMTTKVQEATAVLRDILMKGIMPDAETYDILVEGFCKVKNLATVHELLGVMLRKTIRISISSYRNAVRLMCSEGKVSRALKLKELMLGKSKSRNLVIHNVLVFQLFSTGNHSSVNQVLDDLRKRELRLDEVSCDFLVYGFSKAKDALTALRYLSTMIAEEARPSNRSLRAAMTALCSSGQLEKALDLSREMERRGCLHDFTIQNAVAETLISRGKLREAECFLDRLSEKKLVPKKNANYDNLIKLFSSRGNLNKAIDLLNVMLRNGTVPSSASYDSVVVSCCASNKLDEAMDFHVEMLDKDLRPRIGTWETLVGSFCQAGKPEEAERVLLSAIGSGETPTREMFRAVIQRYRSENSLRKASEVVEMMQRSGLEPDFDTHWSVIGGLRKSADDSRSKGFLSRLLSDSGFFNGK